MWGRRTSSFAPQEGHKCMLKMQVTDVHRPLVSVSRLCDDAQNVVLTIAGGYSQHEERGQTMSFYRRWSPSRVSSGPGSEGHAGFLFCEAFGGGRRETEEEEEAPGRTRKSRWMWRRGMNQIRHGSRRCMPLLSSAFGRLLSCRRLAPWLAPCRARSRSRRSRPSRLVPLEPAGT